VPKTVEAALKINKNTGTKFWHKKAIEKEMKNVQIVFKILKLGAKATVGHQHIGCHMIFNIKFD
jgi:hypothetical protein